jgi:copper chaperone
LRQQSESRTGEYCRVSSANVSLEEKQVTIQYDDTKAEPKQFTEAIKKAGFEVIA